MATPLAMIGSLFPNDPLWMDRAFLTFFIKPLIEFVIHYKINAGSLLAFAVQLLLFMLGRKAPGDDAFMTPPNQLKPAYDFIVVGGGISGCIVAKRLSANYSVLLITGPGGAPDALSRVPAWSVSNLGDKKHDFRYKSKVVKGTAFENGKRVYNGGKDFGGSQLLSGNMWVYGKPADFVLWNDVGLTAFNFKQVRAYGAKHEKATEEILQLSNASDYAYGNNGEIHLRYADTPATFQIYQSHFLNGMANATSSKVIDDYNGNSLGFSRFIQSIEDDTGIISAGPRAFFEKGVPKNLHIVLRSMVKRVIIEQRPDGSHRATGVEWGNNERTNATKKVVLCAGPIKTPQLLMLSGIGNKTKLEELNITSLVDRPGVGENFHDHNRIGHGMVCFPNRTYIDLSTSSSIEFMLNPSKGNFLKSSGYANSIGFFNMRLPNRTNCPNVANHSTCRPDFELILHTMSPNNQLTGYIYVGTGVNYTDFVKDFYDSNKEIQHNFYPWLKFLSKYLDKILNQPECLYLTPILLQSESRGRIELVSSKIEDNPVIDYDILANPRDEEMLADLLLQTQDGIDKAFAPLMGKFNTAVFDQCSHIQNKTSLEFGKCMVRRYTASMAHPSGTARLGRRDDLMAVVDEDFNVIGVEGLGVADASILVAPISGHMLATVAAFAEIAAEKYSE